MRNFIIMALGLGLLIAGGAYLHFRSDDGGLPLTFNGEANQLKRTVFVPILETTIPTGTSVIWSAGLSLCWKKAEASLKGPLRIDSAASLSASVSAAEVTESDIDLEQAFFAAGFRKDGVVERIRREAGRTMPSLPSSGYPADSGAPEEYIVFGALQGRILFPVPYTEVPDQTFKDSEGNFVPVTGFGIHHSEQERQHELKQQLAVLYAVTSEHPDPQSGGKTISLDEFAIDLYRSSSPYQIVLSRMPTPATLQAGLDHVASLTEAHVRQPREMPPLAGLFVPNFAFQVTRHFLDLVGGLTGSPGGGRVADVVQVIQFHLDKCGAVFSMGGTISSILSMIPMNYDFNRPFLMLVRKRGSKAPVLAFWIDNTELMRNRGP